MWRQRGADQKPKKTAKSEKKLAKREVVGRGSLVPQALGGNAKRHHSCG
jgi:hypothetical protein